MGSGTTAIASCNLGRKVVGIDLSEEYKNLAYKRFENNKIDTKKIEYILGDSMQELDTIKNVDYIITSPPYLFL